MRWSQSTPLQLDYPPQPPLLHPVSRRETKQRIEDSSSQCAGAAQLD